MNCNHACTADGFEEHRCMLPPGHAGDHWDGAGGTWSQAQPTGLGICTDAVQSSGEAPAKRHPIPGVVTSFVVDANPGLGQYDPIVVHLIDYAGGRGAITLSCYNMAWTGYFGAMGPMGYPSTIAQFVKGASVGYLNTKLRGECNRRDKRTEQYLDRVILTVQAAL